jgi:hypothetical protein
MQSNGPKTGVNAFSCGARLGAVRIAPATIFGLPTERFKVT